MKTIARGREEDGENGDKNRTWRIRLGRVGDLERGSMLLGFKGGFRGAKGRCLQVSKTRERREKEHKKRKGASWRESVGPSVRPCRQKLLLSKGLWVVK